MTGTTNCKVSGTHSGFAEDSPAAFYAVTLGKYFPMFRLIILPSCSWWSILGQETLLSSETSRPVYQPTQRKMPEHLILQAFVLGNDAT